MRPVVKTEYGGGAIAHIETPTGESMTREALLALVTRADSYLSLLWHRHVPPDRKPFDLQYEVEQTIGELRAATRARALATPPAGHRCDVTGCECHVQTFHAATPPADPYGDFVADVREAAEQAGWDGATNLRAWVIARLTATPPATPIGEEVAEPHPFVPDSTGVFCATCGSTKWARHEPATPPAGETQVDHAQGRWLAGVMAADYPTDVPTDAELAAGETPQGEAQYDPAAPILFLKPPLHWKSREAIDAWNAAMAHAVHALRATPDRSEG